MMLPNWPQFNTTGVVWSGIKTTLQLYDNILSPSKHFLKISVFSCFNS